MPVVLDVSATMSWLVEDERDDLAVYMAETILDDGAIVPALWRWELRNALVVAERRARLTRTDVQELLRDLAGMPIRTDVSGLTSAEESEITLARRYGLTVYDAAYLDLSFRTGERLMTRDSQLVAAAKDLGLWWEPNSPQPRQKKDQL